MHSQLLLVDDDENVINSLTRALHEENYDIKTVKSAEDALVYLDGHKVDLIISDYKLSGMNGVDFLEKVNKHHPEVVAILLTGHADVHVATDVINRLSLCKFLVKPWNNKELQTAVREALRKHDLDVLLDVTAADIMSKFPVVVKEGMPLSTAAELMMRFKISGLPVLSLSGKLTGMITATDLFRVMGETEAKVASGKAASVGDLSIDEVMSASVHTINCDMTLKDMILLMFGKNVHTLPVMEGDEIIGIVGRRDILSAYYHTPRTHHGQ